MDLECMRDCERYHCLPSQLDGEDYHVLSRHRAIAAAEADYQKRDSRARASRPRRR